MEANKRFFPVATAVVCGVTSVMTLLQFAYPEVLSALRRNSAALDQGEWWRIVTPLLVHADGWGQFISNICLLAVIGFAAEKLFGPGRFILLYLAGGLAGELAGYASWDPYGAGASVGFCGLIGGLSVMIVSRNARINMVSAIFALYFIISLVGTDIGNRYVMLALIAVVALMIPVFLRLKNGRRLLNVTAAVGSLAGAVILLFSRDIHGAAVTGGACVCLILQLTTTMRPHSA